MTRTHYQDYVHPARARAAPHADLAAPGGQLPARRAPRDARRDHGRKANPDTELGPRKMVAALRETRSGHLGPVVARSYVPHNRAAPRDAIGPQALVGSAELAAT